MPSRELGQHLKGKSSRADWVYINNMEILCQAIHPYQAMCSPTLVQALGEKPGASPCGQAVLICGAHCGWSLTLPRAPWSAALDLPELSLVGEAGTSPGWQHSWEGRALSIETETKGGRQKRMSKKERAREKWRQRRSGRKLDQVSRSWDCSGPGGCC